jgi:hypothetical protein
MGDNPLATNAFGALVRNHPRREVCQGANVLVGVSPQWGEI